MQAYVGTFRIRDTDGSQDVTEIVDRDGVAFQPDYILAVNGSSELEVLYANPSALTNCVTLNANLFRASDRAAGYGAIGDLPQFGAKIVSGGGGTGLDAALDCLEPNAFSGGFIYRTCQITAVAVGAFTLVVTTLSPNFPTDVMFLALAAEAGDFVMTTNVGTASPLVVDFARGILNVAVSQPILDSGSVATGAGGAGGWGWGWDSPDGGPMGAKILIRNNPGVINPHDLRYQNTLGFVPSISDITFVATPGPSVTAWDPTQIELSASPGSQGYVIAGETIRTSSGTFTQPNTPGLQTIDLRINARAVFLVSIGAEEAPDVLTDWAEICIAFLDGTRQASYWGGENAVGPPLNGAGFLSAVSTLRFAAAGPKGPSTSFTAVAEFVSLLPTGLLTINWSSVDGVARQILWFAIGTEATTIFDLDCPTGLFTLNSPDDDFTIDTVITLTQNDIPVPVEIVSVAPSTITFRALASVTGTSIFCVTIANPGAEPVTICEAFTCPGCPAVLD